MKKLLVMMALAIGFSGIASATDQSFGTSLKLFKPITISKIQDLLFPDTTLTGAGIDIVVATADSGAATFNAQGGKNRNITKSVVESSIDMSAPGVVGHVAVDTFVLAGPTAFDASGDANGLKVGATAHVLAASEDGNYTGTATFRVIYQ
jgi:hypothetical protein